MVIYKFLKDFYLHIKYSTILSSVYKKENLLENLSDLFKHRFKKDWVGRIYTIINPMIKDGKFDETSQVFEYKETGVDNSAYIEQYVMEKLIIAKEFLYTNNLFDMLSYDIKKLDNYGNYLFIMKPITYDDFIKSSKRFFIVYGVLTILFLIGYLLFKLNIF